MRTASSLAFLIHIAVASFTVTVRDAATGTILSNGLVCALYDESNAVVATSENSCSLSVPSCYGNACPTVFRLSVSKDGYYPISKSGLQQVMPSINVQLSKQLTLSTGTKQLRVVLSWGNAHRDLDSYMIVPPTHPSANSCTVNYNRKNCPSAELDVDDTDNYGPETTTLTNPHSGTYSYLVHIYPAGSPKCWDTSGIQAKVEVWGSKNGGLIKSLSQPRENPEPRCSNMPQPADTCHQYWHVFDLDSTTNQFTWVNKMVPDLAAADSARSASQAMATYLPANDAPCNCNMYPGAGTASNWASTTATTATTLASALLGDNGMGDTATCHGPLQGYFDNAITKSSSHTSWGNAVLAARDDLATKIAARFEARKAVAISMRDRAKAIYSLTHEGAPGNNVGPMCENPCAKCYFDASFKTRVNRNSFGLRYGAKAAAVGSTERSMDEKVVRGLGVMAADTFTEHPTTKWQYYGSENGVNFIAPQVVGSSTSCRTYDPRLRPWYVEARTRAKNVVIVIDAAGAVTTQDLLSLKAAAKGVLGTLAAGDTANIVVGRNSGTLTNSPGDDPSDLTYKACQKDQMLRTVPTNKALLSRYIDQIKPQDASTPAMDIATALSRAQTLLAAQRTFASANYDSISSSDVVVILMSSTPNPTLTTVKNELSPPAFWSRWQLVAPGGSYTMMQDSMDDERSFTALDAGFAPARYYMHGNLNKNPDDVAPGSTFASAFYEDNSGLGLVTTIVSPVYEPPGMLKGVVGLDVTVEELVADVVFDREFTSSYAFIVDAAGSVVWHPALPSPGDGVAKTVNIKDLETDPDFATLVYAKLVKGEEGSEPIEVDTPVTRGDATYSGFSTVKHTVEYAYKPVAGTPFRLCVAMTNEDANPRPLAHPSTPTCMGTSSQKSCDVYHNLELRQTCDSEDTTAARRRRAPMNIGRRRRRARVRTRRSLSSDIKIIQGKSAVFYAASAFERPAAWLTHKETEQNARDIANAHTCSATAAPLISKAVLKLKQAAIEDNMVARQVDGCWKDAQETADARPVWTYFGSANGLWRVMPATFVKKKYEAAKRPWYLAAVANKNNGEYSATISTPYLDASGAGEVVTASRVVTRGGSGANYPVAGVVGADFKLDEVRRIIEQNGKCGLDNVNCMLLDETAHLIYHADFVDSPEAEENMFLAAKHREVAKALLSNGVMVQNTCMDYASGYRKTSYKLSLSGTAKGTLSCGLWALSRAGKTNMYLLALSSNGCIQDYGKRTQVCKPCNEANCASAGGWPHNGDLLCQPCQCKIEYNSCSLGYGQATSTPSACPASPPPLFSDLCPNEYNRGGGEDDSPVVGAIIGFVVFVAFACGLRRACNRKNSDGSAKQRQTRQTRQATPQPAVQMAPQVVQYGQPQVAVAMPQGVAAMPQGVAAVPQAAAVVPQNPAMQQPNMVQVVQVAPPPSYTA